MAPALLLVLLASAAAQAPATPAPARAAQAEPPVTVSELAAYRLTDQAFMRFVAASRGIAGVVRADPRFADAPIFTRDVMLSDDAAAAAAALEGRLQADRALRQALQAAQLSPREYTVFALSLYAAHLAHGFVAAQVLRRVPEGPAADNVAFVEEHRLEIDEVLDELGVTE